MRKPRSPLRPALAWLCLFAFLFLSATADAQPKAKSSSERVAKLAQRLTTAKASKTRLAAAVQLAELRDRRSVRPFMRALKDRNRGVRAIAATALGHLGDPAAITALQGATRDNDKSVRRTALVAIAQIRRAQATEVQPRRRDKLSSYSIPATETPRLKLTKPEVFVVLKSATDESKGKMRKKARLRREKHMRKLMLASLKGSPGVTISDLIAKKNGLSPYFIDLSILDFKRHINGRFIEVECQLRIAVSDKRNKILSVMTGGARVQVPRRTFRKQYEPRLRLEALENAVQGMHYDVLSYLHRNPS